MRYPDIYTRTAEAFNKDFSLTGVEARPSTSGTGRSVVVIFAYTHRVIGNTEKFFVRVDVTGEFPFLLNKMSPFIESTT